MEFLVIDLHPPPPPLAGPFSLYSTRNMADINQSDYTYREFLFAGD
jgi:hypothetical protein